jgi:hypothetical protein
MKECLVMAVKAVQSKPRTGFLGIENQGNRRQNVDLYVYNEADKQCSSECPKEFSIQSSPPTWISPQSKIKTSSLACQSTFTSNLQIKFYMSRIKDELVSLKTKHECP